MNRSVNGVDGLDGARSYVAAYTDDAVSWYERNASTGALTYGGVLKDGVNGVDGLDGARSVTLSSDREPQTGPGDASTGAFNSTIKDGQGGDVEDSVIGRESLCTDDAVSWYERKLKGVDGLDQGLCQKLV